MSFGIRESELKKKANSFLVKWALNVHLHIQLAVRVERLTLDIRDYEFMNVDLFPSIKTLELL